MAVSPHELEQRLADNAEAVCRHYLGNGHRQGRYWIVGDVRNTPGRSLFVRLEASPNGPAGKWTDYVARRVMLRPRAGRPFCEGWAASPQHNLSLSGRVA